MDAFKDLKFLKSVEGKLLINGKFVNATSKTTYTVRNPKDGSVVTDKQAIAGAEDVELAYQSARDAYKGEWSRWSGPERAEAFFRLADLIEKNRDELAFYESIVSGRLVGQLTMENQWIARVVRYFGGWCDKIEGESITDDDGFYKVIRKEPMGVCAGITPWNGPTIVFVGKVAPALAAGNTVILKPPEKSPYSSLFLGSLFKQAGFPDGVLNVVTGDGSTGNLLASHNEIACVSFTGSVPVGRKINAAANASNMKRVILELGGKNPAVVFPDADLKKAAYWLAQGVTMNAGQVCSSTSRVIVHESVAEQVIADIKTTFDEIAKKAGGDPLDMKTSFAPVVDELQYNTIHKFIEQGKSEAELVTGGYKFSGPGFWVPPTIFKNPAPDAQVYKEEVFGPVIVIRTFKEEQEALDLANDTTFGLAAYLWTSNVERIFRMSKAMEAGWVGVNSGVALFPNAPYGGYKTSGAHKEYGKAGLEAFMNVKVIYISTGEPIMRMVPK